jgi:hypothetical protein
MNGILTELAHLWRWIFSKDHRVRDFPPATAFLIWLVITWTLWQYLETLKAALVLELTAVTVIVIWRLAAWFTEHTKQVEDRGIPVVWWKRLTRTVTHNNTFADADERWSKVCQGRLQWGPAQEKREPALLNKQLTPLGEVKALIKLGDIGGDLNSVSSLALSVIPGIMKCRVPIIEPVENDPGSAWITFPDPNADPLAEVIPIIDLPVGSQTAVSFGRTELAKCAEIRKGLSVLITGVTEAGKGSVAWSMIFDLFRDGEPTEVYVIDPKHMEFSVLKDYVGKWIGCLYIADYVDNENDAKTMFKTFRDTMDKRQIEFGKTGRKMEKATKDFPARVIIADELSDIKGCFDSKAGGTSSDFGIIIAQGRTTRDWIIGQNQLAKITTLGDCRDQFPLRICLRTTTAEQTKSALGIAESEGNVYCSKIPVNKQGTGYYVHENGEARKFRAAYAKDEHIKIMLEQKRLPDRMLTRDLVAEWTNGQRPHYLYRAWTDRGHCYTGETNDRARRYGEHRRDDVWPEDLGPCPHCGVMLCRWWEKHVIYTESVECLSRDIAKQLEAAEIAALNPPFNRKGANKPMHIRAAARMSYKAPVFTPDGDQLRPATPARRVRKLRPAGPDVRVDPVIIEGEVVEPEHMEPATVKVYDEPATATPHLPLFAPYQPPAADATTEPEGVLDEYEVEVADTTPSGRVRRTLWPRRHRDDRADLATVTTSNEHMSHIDGWGGSE